MVLRRPSSLAVPVRASHRPAPPVSSPIRQLTPRSDGVIRSELTEPLVHGGGDGVPLSVGGFLLAGRDRIDVAELQISSSGKGGDPEVEVSPAGGLDAAREVSSEVELHHRASAWARGYDRSTASETMRMAMSRSFTFSRWEAATRSSKASSSLQRCAAMSMPLACSMTAR